MSAALPELVDSLILRLDPRHAVATQNLAIVSWNVVAGAILAVVLAAGFVLILVFTKLTADKLLFLLWYVIMSVAVVGAVVGIPHIGAEEAKRR